MESKEEILAKAKELRDQASMLESQVYKTFVILYYTPYNGNYYDMGATIERKFKTWFKFNNGVYLVSDENLTSEDVKKIINEKCKDDDRLLVLSIYRPGFFLNLDDGSYGWLHENLYLPYPYEDNV